MTIINLNIEKKYPIESELEEAIWKVIHEFDYKISVVSVLGILEIVKTDLINQATME